MNDLISRQEAIDTLYIPDYENGEAYSQYVNDKRALESLPSAQTDLTNIVFETLAECGIYGEEATVKYIGVLKRLGRSDLLSPCVR